MCGVERNWNADDILKNINNQAKNEVGDGKVLLALSGGVDSTVLASVLHKKLEDRLVCVMVDHGLLRKDEANNVVTNLKEKIGLKVNLVNAQAVFLKKLKGIKDPEEKEKLLATLL